MGKGSNRKTTHSKGHPQQQVKLVSTYNSSPELRWRKVHSPQLQSIKQGYQEVHLANAKSRGYLFQAEWGKVFFNPRFEGRLSSYSLGQILDTKNGLQLAFQKA